MDFGSINWLAVIVCVLVSFAVGFFYFSPKVFFDVWWKALGKTGQPGTANMGMTWGLTTLASIVLAVGMAFAVPAIAGAMSSGVNAVSGALDGLHAVAALPGCDVALESALRAAGPQGLGHRGRQSPDRHGDHGRDPRRLALGVERCSPCPGGPADAGALSFSALPGGSTMFHRHFHAPTAGVTAARGSVQQFCAAGSIRAIQFTQDRPGPLLPDLSLLRRVHRGHRSDAG